eukprot:scaffold69908_cov39-Cyclotella_meneghiniana.AAC.5
MKSNTFVQRSIYIEVCLVLISREIRDLRSPRDQTPRDEKFETRSRDEISPDVPTRLCENGVIAHLF